MSADSKALMLYFMAMIGYAVGNVLGNHYVASGFLGAWLAIGILKVVGCFKEMRATAERQEPEIGPIYPDGSMQRWCKWCGFRASYQPRGAHTAEDLRAKIDHFRSHK